MKQIIMVHIPKCAGGSVRHWFKNHVNDYKLDTGHKLLKEFDIEPKFKFSFCITRNTYDRLVSWYEWLLFSIAKDIKKQKNLEYNLKIYQILEKGFSEWLKWSFESTETDQTQLTRLQNDWIKNVDYVLRHENLQEDFKIIQNDVKCFVPLEKTNHVMHYNKEKYFTDKNISLIEEFFKKEIDYFNYKVEI